MIRNLKALGLALVAIFAMSALAASGASAQALTSGGPVTLDGQEVGEAGDNALTSLGGELRCPGSTYTGHEVGSSSAPLPNGSTAVTLSAHHNQAECASVKDESTFSSTVEMTSCDYVLDLGETTKDEDTYAATVDIVCSGSDEIHVTQFSGESHGFRVCAQTVPAQAELGGDLQVTDETNGHLGLEGTVTGIHLTRSGLCGAATDEEAVLHLNIAISGTNAAGGDTGVGIEKAPVDPQPALTADGPVTLDAVEVGAANENASTAFGGVTRCPGSTYTGHKVSATPHELMPSGATKITLTPHYNQEDCAFETGGSSFSTTIEMTSCDYVLTIGATTPGGDGTYGVTTDVVCDVPGDQIHRTQFSGESHGFRVCSVTEPEQTGLSGAHLTDEGNGHLRLQGTFTGIESIRSGLCGSATQENGELHLNATVSGTDALGEPTPVSLSD